MPRVFVYGTLKRGFPNFDTGMRTALYKGRCRTRERFPLVVAGPWHTPCLIDEPGSGFRVFGELYDVTEACLEGLDRIEHIGQPNGYHRREIAVSVNDSEDQDVWAYLRARNTLDAIHRGPLEEYALDPDYIEPGDPRRQG